MNYIVRFELIDGTTGWRRVENFDPETLCRAFSLDPNTACFDIPSSARLTGRNQVGYGDHRDSRQHRIDGVILWGHDPNKQKPIGKFSAIYESERLRDDWLKEFE